MNRSKGLAEESLAGAFEKKAAADTGGTCPLCWEYHRPSDICREVARWSESRQPEHEQLRSKFEAWIVWHFSRVGMHCRRAELSHCPGGWQHNLIDVCRPSATSEQRTRIFAFGIKPEGGSEWGERAPTLLRVHDESGIAIVRDEDDGHETINRADILELRGSGIRAAALRCFRRLLLAKWHSCPSYAGGLHTDIELCRSIADATGDDISDIAALAREVVESSEAG